MRSTVTRNVPTAMMDSPSGARMRTSSRSTFQGTGAIWRVPISMVPGRTVRRKRVNWPGKGLEFRTKYTDGTSTATTRIARVTAM